LITNDDQGRSHASPDLVAEVRRREMAIPNELAHCAISNFETPQLGQGRMRRQVTDWAQRAASGAMIHHGLLISGGTGIGKSHLAVAAMKKLVMRYTPMFCHFAKMANDLARNSWDSDPIGDYSSPDLLLIDEFGGVAVTPAVAERFRIILLMRASDRLPTILTTNLRWPAEFAPGPKSMAGARQPQSGRLTLDDRLISRMSQGYQIVQEVDLPDWRMGEATR